MGQDKFQDWIPLEGVPKRVNVSSLSDADIGLRVELRGEASEGVVIVMQFESPVAYRNVNESYRLRTWSRLDMAKRSSLQVVFDSEWVDWLRAEAGGVLDGVELFHYAIFTDEDCVEVVTEFPPKIVRLEC